MNEQKFRQPIAVMDIAPEKRGDACRMRVEDVSHGRTHADAEMSDRVVMYAAYSRETGACVFAAQAPANDSRWVVFQFEQYCKAKGIRPSGWLYSLGSTVRDWDRVKASDLDYASRLYPFLVKEFPG